MSTFIATANVPTEKNGWFGSLQVPSFTIEAHTPTEAAKKVAAILTTTGGKAYVGISEVGYPASYSFVAEAGEAANFHILPLV